MKKVFFAVSMFVFVFVTTKILSASAQPTPTIQCERACVPVVNTCMANCKQRGYPTGCVDKCVARWDLCMQFCLM